MCFCGYKYITDWGKPEEEVDIAELQEEVKIEESNLLGTYYSKYDDLDETMDIEDCILEIFKDADVKGVEYLIKDTASESNEWEIISVTEDEMNDYILMLNSEIDWSETGLEGKDTGLTNIEETKENIELIIYGFEKNYSALADGIMYLALCTEQDEAQYRALGRSIYTPDANSGSGNQGLLFKSLKDDGLVLDVKNVKTKAILINKARMLSVHNEYALVEAEIKCIENSGVYRDLSWVPEEGETTSVKFVISYESVSVPSWESRRCIFVFDIAYLE